MIAKISRSYGGELLTKAKNRRHGRPISTQHSMHFVLRSTQAREDWSFWRHKRAIREIIDGFALKYGIRLKSMANVGNHIHMHLQLTNRQTYRPFIRAITGAIMMVVTGASRWNKQPIARLHAEGKKFWDRRPFSRIVVGFKAMLTMRDYIWLDQLESQGLPREMARDLLKG